MDQYFEAEKLTDLFGKTKDRKTKQLLALTIGESHMNYKEIARKILPPVFRDYRARIIEKAWRKKTIGKLPFLSWWDSQKMSDTSLPDLTEMINHFISTPESQLMSDYWWFLAKRNIEQLLINGYENFKQTVARNYYTWVGDDANILMRKVSISDAMKLSGSLAIPVSEIFKKHDHFTFNESLSFNINTILMYSALGAPLVVEEPIVGNPPGILINHKLVTQDLLNSFLDYRSISKCCDLENVRCLLELGAGYGRTAYYILSMQPKKMAYIIVDIPPALYIAQRYLIEQFPEKKALVFNPNLKSQEVSDAILNRAIIFMTPDQLKLLDSKSIDLWVAIDNLHAMTMPQVESYLGQINRLANKFYFTYWPEMPMPYDDYTHDVEAWPIPETWKLLHKESTYIPSCYINVTYQLG